MIFVGCSGFPVPASRYWGEFSGIELTETELGIPGEGTIRRWKRDSPKKFAFSMFAPKELAETKFAASDENAERIVEIGKVATKLKAKAVVFQAPDDFKPTPTNRKKVKAFLNLIPADFPARVVLDFPLWKPAQILSATNGFDVVPAYDPLSDDAPKSELAYVRLPGPAGRRSRYDDKAISKIAEHCAGLESKDVLCVFRNQDMFVNAKATRQNLT